MLSYQLTANLKNPKKQEDKHHEMERNQRTI